MKELFNPEKATQIAIFLLKLNGGRLDYTKAIKLIYIADRMSLLENKIPISLDKYVSMDKGPVVSNIYDMIKGATDCVLWNEYIKTIGYNINLRKDFEQFDLLSKNEKQMLVKVDAEFKRKSCWVIIDYMHEHFKEWEDPDGSSYNIEIEDIMKALQKSNDEIRSIQEDLNYLKTVKNLLSARVA